MSLMAALGGQHLLTQLEHLCSRRFIRISIHFLRTLNVCLKSRILLSSDAGLLVAAGLSRGSSEVGGCVMHGPWLAVLLV